MKKSKIVIVAIVILLALSAGMLTACDVPVDHEEAFALLKKNYEESIKYDIFYSKEMKNNNVNKEFLRVNSVCTANNKNEYVKNSDGTYKDHAVRVYYEKDSAKQFEITVGLSKDGKKDPGKYLKFNETYTGKNDKNEAQFDRSYTSMTPGEYIKSEEFTPYLLKSKFAEIGRLERKDVVFYEKGGATKTGELTNIKFKLTDEYYAKYLEEMGVESTLKGTYITMELLYGRIGNITVMQEEVGTESIFGVSEYESYKLEVVYLGPKIQDVPNYNAVNEKKEKVWKELN